jgi:pilus assembly protein CpaB
MLLRITLFLVIGLGSAGFAIVGWLGLHSSLPSAEAAAAPHNRAVLVAARQLNAGSLLKPEDITGAEVTDADPKTGAWSDTQVGRSELMGAMIRRSLAPHEVVMPADVMRPGDHGFLAAVLGAGERAISVGVDAVSGNSGLIWPGDHVDLILTQALDASSAPPGRRIAGETVLHNVRVIAIDQDLVRGGGNSARESTNNRTVTLEVSPQEAERVSVAVRLGKLSLVVVSADQANDASPAAPVAVSDSITWGGDVSHALRQGGGDRGTIRVFQGPTESKEFRF